MGMGIPGDGGAGIKGEDTGNRDTGIRNGKPAAEMGALRAKWGHQNRDIRSRNGHARNGNGDIRSRMGTLGQRLGATGIRCGYIKSEIGTP